jgi:hypothetical protein
LGGAAERVSALAGASGSEKPIDEIRLVLLPEVPRAVPFGP